jgi:MtN3 and saliva related transmembrane protein
MISFTTLIGLLAAFFTTVSYVPQLKKCWATGSAEDLSLRMLLILAAGISLWVVYGLLQKDPVIVLANSVSLLLLANILYFKLREVLGRKGREAPH